MATVANPNSIVKMDMLGRYDDKIKTYIGDEIVDAEEICVSATEPTNPKVKIWINPDAAGNEMLQYAEDSHILSLFAVATE